jgi:hypothetical protein
MKFTFEVETVTGGYEIVGQDEAGNKQKAIAATDRQLGNRVKEMALGMLASAKAAEVPPMGLEDTPI